MLDTSHLPPLACDIPTACRRLGIGRTKLYDLMQAGELRAVRFGARTVIPESELLALIARHLSGDPKRAA